MAQPILQVNQLVKQFSHQTVLDGLSFSIYPQEKVAIIGSSGSGKTTLMSLLMKLKQPDSGKIMIQSQSIKEYTQRKIYAQKIGMLNQQYDLIEELPVLQNVLCGHLNDWSFTKALKSFIRPKDTTVALQALEQVGLEEKATQLTYHLSGGEKQRVALARLLVQQPTIVLVDEPTSSLDPARSHDILSLITRLTEEQNQTLIASMHSIEYVKQYFDRVIGIRDGQICFDGPTMELTQDAINQIYEL
ncbi:phosphonate ABC transporter ATP-binding protein [Dolosigranulum pigrum]|uniref:ATP-binding cassette domain-containing protein n=1 Tax=Dolosigranulum pigrum TaxID=29394 RepID=A0A516GKI7_9LACT|nr:ATP-binding cassette domain-containing protein [Dolosigranulum pigrum]QDO92031.1 ATP-binding cassette domain-containing protein [Dolosigranulum pigrum]